MEPSDIPQDDLLDVIEMTDKIEGYISKVIKGNERHLAVSALLTASINCMLSQCETVEEIVICGTIFMQILDSSIRAIQIKEKEKPSRP